MKKLKGLNIFSIVLIVVTSMSLSGKQKNNSSNKPLKSTRAYQGAPPSIPHPALDTSSENSSNCLSCHLHGNYIAKWKKWPPKTPHPTYLSCRQCHVAKQTNKNFRKSNWKNTVDSKISLQSSKKDFIAKNFYHQTKKDLNNVEIAIKEHYTGKQQFFVTKRTHNMLHYPCQECHNGSKVEESIHPHKNISKAHPGMDFASCKTCHNAKTGDLTNLGGEKVSFEHSYLICAQCHSTQAKDWSGGAHGKRVSNWQNKRVVQNCTTCHNPHKPGFSKRLPVIFKDSSN